MNYHYPDEDVHLKFRLKKHKIGHVYDFKHNYINDTMLKKIVYTQETENMLSIYDTNHNELSNMLGIDITKHDIKIVITALDGSGGGTSTSLLSQKLARLEDFYKSLINYIFDLTHMLYYTYFIDDENKQKSGKTFQQCLELGIDIGMDIRRKYEKIFDKEFNATPNILKYLESLKEAVK